MATRIAMFCSWIENNVAVSMALHDNLLILNLDDVVSSST